MLLPLAERMVKKYIKENKIEAEAGKSNSDCRLVQMDFTMNGNTAYFAR